ncbi:P-loop NTPase [Microbulbifer taiwanensis]|uniref:P-loop NTPase n=1 Tax=Microbulbifer taiwanensis TaxID=986746 RepID=UPI003615950E
MRISTAPACPPCSVQRARPQVREQKFFLPVEVQGLRTMSLGYLMTEETPAVWRGPMASGALNQILTQTIWCEEGASWITWWWICLRAPAISS